MFPVLFRWGGFSLHAYGLFIAVGFLLGIGLALKEARRQGLSGERLLDLSLVIIISAMIGSRLLYAIIHYPQYLKDPLSIFKIWEGGLVFFGGLILAFVVGGWYIKKVGLPFWETADLLAPSPRLRAGLWTPGLSGRRVLLRTPHPGPLGRHLFPSGMSGPHRYRPPSHAVV